MDDNKDIEKVSRNVFDNFRMDAPDNAWDKLDADLDKRQAVVFKKRANRFKLLSILLLLLIFSFTTWHYLIPTSTTKKLNNVAAENNRVINKASSTNIEPKSNVPSNIPSVNLIPSKNKNTSATAKESNTQEFNDSQNPKLTFAVNSVRKQKNRKPIHYQKQNNSAGIINFPTDKNEKIVEPESTEANTISNEAVNVAHDSDKTNETELNVLAENISVNGLQITADTNKAAPAYFIKSDSLFKKDLHSKSRLSLAVFYSPNQSWCNLKDNTADNIDDVAMYNNRENSKFSYTTGLTLKYDLNNKWSVLSGVTYSTIAKSITLQTMYAKANADNEMHFEYPTSNGVIEIPSDDTHPNLHDGDSMNVNADGKQAIKFINVPLMVRFQLTKKKFTWYANGGFSANFIVQEKAKINMNNSEMTIINHVNGLKKMNYGFLIGTGIQYNMYDDLGIFIEPMFRGSFTSITRNTAVNSYPYSLGLNLGISLHF